MLPSPNGPHGTLFEYHVTPGDTPLDTIKNCPTETQAILVNPVKLHDNPVTGYPVQPSNSLLRCFEK